MKYILASLALVLPALAAPLAFPSPVARQRSDAILRRALNDVNTAVLSRDLHHVAKRHGGQGGEYYGQKEEEGGFIDIDTDADVYSARALKKRDGEEDEENLEDFFDLGLEKRDDEDEGENKEEGDEGENKEEEEEGVGLEDLFDLGLEKRTGGYESGEDEQDEEDFLDLDPDLDICDDLSEKEDEEYADPKKSYSETYKPTYTPTYEVKHYRRESLN